MRTPDVLHAHGYTARVSRGRTVASLAGCGLAGLVVGLVVAVAPDATAQTGTTVSTTTTVPTTVTTTAPPPVTTTAPPVKTAPLPRQPDVIAAGVTVGSILVGGLSGPEARELLEQRFAKPLTLVVDKARRLRMAPQELGATAYVGKAVKRARSARAGARLTLDVKLAGGKLRRWLHTLGRDVRREPVDSRLLLRGLRPFATQAKPGRRLEEPLARREISKALRTHVRAPLALPFKALQPKVTPDTIGSAIVIRRGSNQLFYYESLKLARSFRVATGQASYPTPLGRWAVAVKWRNPWWYPPPSDWAQDSKPIPPGPGNPLGTRWMGLTAPYVGIHGTPDAASIGYSASHGCIRMLIPEVEWLFDRVDIGTTVFVVAA
jgi:lipoprotein-anchoring transpeptidase ErfK/SrfK